MYRTHLPDAMYRTQLAADTENATAHRLALGRDRIERISSLPVAPLTGTLTA